MKNVFSVKWWVGKLSELKEVVVDLPTGIASHIGDCIKLLGEFLGNFKALSNTVGPYISWLRIVGIVSSIIDIVKGIPSTISKGIDADSLRKAAVAALKKLDASSALLADAAEYGFYKVLRGFAANATFLRYDGKELFRSERAETWAMPPASPDSPLRKSN